MAGGDHGSRTQRTIPGEPSGAPDSIRTWGWRMMLHPHVSPLDQSRPRGATPPQLTALPEIFRPERSQTCAPGDTMAKPWHRWPPPLRVPDGSLRLTIYARDGNECRIRLPGCIIRPTELDHIISPEWGGAWWDPSNLRAACGNCNRARSNPKAHHNRTPSSTRPSPIR